MPRNMSFSLTTDQVRNQTKTVTRRKGWWKNKAGKRLLQVGDIVNACVKCMGLKPGEKIERICQIRIVNVRREPLANTFLNDELQFSQDHASNEAALEGFPEMQGREFADMFCDHMGGDESQEVTRIEFEYMEDSRG